MPVANGTQSIKPIYNGVNKIIAVYRGTDLCFKLEDELSKYIIPEVINSSQNTNIVYSATDNSLSGMATSGSYYRIGTGTGDSSSSATQNNGLTSESSRTDTIFYIPSKYNNTTVFSLSSYAFSNLILAYPNLTHIVLGEGTQKLGSQALCFDNLMNSTSAITGEKPRIYLPKSLKVLWKNSLGYLHIYEFVASNYLYYHYNDTNETSTSSLGSRLSGCEIDKCILDSPLLELDYNSTTMDYNYSLISGALKSNTINSLEFKTITKLGKYALRGLTIKKINFGSLTTLGDNSLVGLPDEVTIPKTVHTFGSCCIISSNIKKLIFKHSNSDSVTFNLNSSNQGPFYTKTARTFDVYTDNDYIRNWDFATNDNSTVTFYHLDGTPW